MVPRRPVLFAALLLASNTAFADCQEGFYEVVINEFLPNPDGADSGAEWVELINSFGTESVDLEGWKVQKATSPGGYGDVFVIPEGVTLGVGERLVIQGASGGLSGLGVLTLDNLSDMGNASSSSDGIRLVDCIDWVQDVVIYGSSNGTDSSGETQVFVDEFDFPVEDANLAPKPGSGKSLGRFPDGADNDDGAIDFLSFDEPTPGAENIEPVDPGDGEPGDGEPSEEECVSDKAGALVINEFLPDPDGSDGGLEWVELYNASPDELSVSGWGLISATSPSNLSSAPDVVFGEDVVVAPGGYFVVADPLVEISDDIDALVLPEEDTLGFGNASSSQDAAVIVDALGCVVDTVVYGLGGDDVFFGDDGEGVTDATSAPKPASGRPLARRLNGEDSDNSADDFVVANVSTLGFANEDLRCLSVGGAIVINEFMPNPAGSDTTARSEWVELFNPTEEAIEISGWEISKVGSVSSSDPTQLNETSLALVSPGTVIEPGEFYLIGGVSFDGADQFVDPFDLGSGSGGDLVVLRDCEGGLVDTVLYGGLNEDFLPEETGDRPAEGAPKTDSEQCLARLEDGYDTNESSVDFRLTARCTPGVTNSEGNGGGGVGGVDPIGRGCNSGAPRDSGVREFGNPQEGCSSSPSPLGGSLMVLLALGVVRRRR